MYLIKETVDSRIEYLTEQTKTGKKLYLEGPFLMSNKRNRNGRVYPKSVLEVAVDKYLREYVSERRAIGELVHPEYPLPDIKKAAIMVESLSWQGDDVYGKALVLNTPDGEIIKALMEANFKMGVSSRGLGDVKTSGGMNEVTRFILNAIDAVDMPSAQVCYVDAINESVQWEDKGGIWVKKKIDVEPAKPKVDLDKLLDGLKQTFKTTK